MIKNKKGWEISKKMGNAKMYVAQFSGAKLRFVKDVTKEFSKAIVLSSQIRNTFLKERVEKSRKRYIRRDFVQPL